MQELEKQSPIIIRRARLSFLWAEVLPAFLEQGNSIAAPYAALTRNFTYSKLFEQARDGALQNPILQAPWLAERRQQFWMRYLVQGKLCETTGKQAWQYLVPVRLAETGLRLQVEGFKGTLFLDAFYYSFGLAFSLTLRWEEEKKLEDFLSVAHKLRTTGAFSFEGENAKLTLDAVADRVLTALRKRALGEGSVAGLRSPQPFSVVTIVEGEGPDPAKDIKSCPEILRALEVLTNWPSDTRYLVLPAPEKVCLPLKQSAPQGTALYAQERGRAVWHPEMFCVKETAETEEKIDQKRRASKMACYHRNLMFASLQTESLGRLASYTAQLFAAGKQPINLTHPHREMAANAARCLGKLYVGDKGNTWRSASMQRQIEHVFLKDMQSILAQFPEATVSGVPLPVVQVPAVPPPAVPQRPVA